MVTFSTKFGEYKLEKLMGGESRFCAIWGALCEKGLRFVSCGSTGKTIVFGMDKKRIWSITFANEAFFQKARNHAIPADDFAATIIQLMAKKNPKLELVEGRLETSLLVYESHPHRVLWLLGVDLLDGEYDRLYDSCIEMGDGSLVMETARRLKDENVISKISECKLSKVTPFVAKREKTITQNNDDVFNLDLFAV